MPFLPSCPICRASGDPSPVSEALLQEANSSGCRHRASLHPCPGGTVSFVKEVTVVHVGWMMWGGRESKMPMPGPPRSKEEQSQHREPSRWGAMGTLHLPLGSSLLPGRSPQHPWLGWAAGGLRGRRAGSRDCVSRQPEWVRLNWAGSWQFAGSVQGLWLISSDPHLGATSGRSRLRGPGGDELGRASPESGFYTRSENSSACIYEGVRFSSGRAWSSR